MFQRSFVVLLLYVVTEYAASLIPGSTAAGLTAAGVVAGLIAVSFAMLFQGHVARIQTAEGALEDLAALIDQTAGASYDDQTALIAAARRIMTHRLRFADEWAKEHMRPGGRIRSRIARLGRQVSGFAIVVGGCILGGIAIVYVYAGVRFGDLGAAAPNANFAGTLGLLLIFVGRWVAGR